MKRYEATMTATFEIDVEDDADPRDHPAWEQIAAVVMELDNAQLNATHIPAEEEVKSR